MLRVIAIVFALVVAVRPTGAAPVMAQEPRVQPLPVTTQAESLSALENQRPEENLTGSITLKSALALALLQNPELRAFEWEVRAREAGILQAGLRINPELSLEIEDVRLSKGPDSSKRGLSLSGTPTSPKPVWELEKESGAHSGFSESQFTLVLSKVVELGGKRFKRMRLAERERNLATWDYEIARANVMKEVAQAFIAVVAGQERLRLEDELVTVARNSAQAIGKLVDAGQVSALELAKAETALSLSEIQLAQAKEALESDRARLVATWGGPRAEFDRAEGALTDPCPLPALEDLYDRVEKNPDLARWADELEQRKALITLESAERIPNVTVSLGLRRTGFESRDISRVEFGPGMDWNAGHAQVFNDADAEDTVYLGLSMPLPILNRNQGAIRAAEHRAAKASEERQASESQIRAALAKAYHSLRAAYVISSTLTQSVIPRAANTFESISKGYEQGEFSYLDVLDAQRTFFEARNQYIDALAAYHENVIALERITGVALWTGNELTGTSMDKAAE
jgi:cobalt-zinc-cadmium efflux system outer membrane protein